MARKQQQQRLGKGLSALLGDYLPEGDASAPDVHNIPVDALRPNPFQPRQGFSEEHLHQLAASIRENGLLQPLLVRPAADDGWEVVAGERRLRAVQKIGWSHVPVVVRDVDDGTMLVLALIENLQREDLNPLDEAQAYRRLVNEFGLTQGEVAQRVGRDRSTVANAMRLVALPEPVKALLAEGRISAGHGRALLGLEDSQLAVELAQAAAEDGLSVREIERRVRRMRAAPRPRERSGTDARPRDEHTSAYAARAEQALARALGTTVKVKLDGDERGRIEISFLDSDDFERIVEAIVGVGGFV